MENQERQSAEALLSKIQGFSLKTRRLIAIELICSLLEDGFSMDELEVLIGKDRLMNLKPKGNTLNPFFISDRQN
jgi:hypothetical protein